MNDDTNTATGGGSPQIVYESGFEDIADLLAKLDLTATRPVIIVSGGAATLDTAIKSRLRRLLTRGVARVAAQIDALIIDGGTRVGVMELMGHAVADLGQQSPLLGIAPAALVDVDQGSTTDRAPLDPHHSHFLLTSGESWGDEVNTMMDVAAAVANGKGVTMVVAGGGPQTFTEVLHAVRRRWPLLLVEGTGGITDQLVSLLQTSPSQTADPVVAEIIRDGELNVVPLHDSPDVLAAHLQRNARADATLCSAWEAFAVLDLNAGQQQRTFRRVQASILGLGFLGALLAVVKSILPDPHPLNQLLYSTVLVIPIVVSVAIATANRFKPGDKWLLMRAAAEAIKREIWRYRTRSGDYHHAGREALLAQKVEDVTRRLARTEVNVAALRPYTGPIPPTMGATADLDDGLAHLAPERYVTLRIGDQLRYYRKAVLWLHRTLVLGERLILGLGGVGTLLAALNQSVWVAVTTTAVTTITTFLGYRRIEATLRTYNQMATDLENVARWWKALRPGEQADPTNLDKLVDCTEKLLASELDGWVQSMQDALTGLRKAQEATTRADDKARSPANTPR